MPPVRFASTTIPLPGASAAPVAVAKVADQPLDTVARRRLSACAFARGVDRVGIDVDGERRARAPLQRGGHRQHAGARAEIEHAPSVDVDRRTSARRHSRVEA